MPCALFISTMFIALLVAAAATSISTTNRGAGMAPTPLEPPRRGGLCRWVQFWVSPSPRLSHGRREQTYHRRPRNVVNRLRQRNPYATRSPCVRTRTELRTYCSICNLTYCVLLFCNVYCTVLCYSAYVKSTAPRTTARCES